MVFGGAIRITVPNIVKIGFCCGDIAIFQIFRMTAADILDFWNRENLLAIALERVEMHKRAKFR